MLDRIFFLNFEKSESETQFQGDQEQSLDSMCVVVVDMVFCR